MISRRILIMSFVFVLLLAACAGLSAAKEIAAGTAVDVQQGTTTAVGIYGYNMSNLDAFAIQITYDSTVMLVTSMNNTYRPGEWTVVQNIGTPGTAIVNGFANTPGDSLSGTASLFGFNCRAEKNDGSSTPLTVTITTTSESSVVVPYTAINGLFTTRDEVAPTITITTPADGATVPQDVTVTATITDVGGVDQSTISVTVGGVALVNPTITPIAGGYTVTGTRTNVPIGAAAVVVSADDLSGNPASVTHNVTVAQSGLTFNPDLDGTYTNATQPVIKADYVQVTGATVKMFINNVDVTAQTTLTPSSATAGSIELNYGAYGPLTDGQKIVVVNGTSSLLGGGELTATETFTKDTIAPVVVINSIGDSDGDGYPESMETLTFAYTITDANPQLIWIGLATSTTFPSGNLVYGVVEGNTLGNRNATVYAVDAAGNVGQSTPFHLYNNYLAYINEASAGTFAGLDLTKTAVNNIFTQTVARAITMTGHTGTMALPTLGILQKTVTGGPNVTVDNRGNDAIPAGTLPDGVPYFINPTGTLNYAVTVPNIDNATLIIGKANSTMIDQLLRGGSASKGSIEEMLSKDKVVIYGKGVVGAQTLYGYRLIKINADGTASELAGGKGTFTFNTDLPTMIRANYIDLRTEFNTATHNLGLEINKIDAGEYVLIAVTLDHDRVSVITAMPFVVTEEASQFTTSAASYNVGDPVVVNWGGAGVPQNIAGVLIRDGSTYTGNVTLDLTTLGTGSLKSMYLLGDGNQTVKKLINKANIWISSGYGNAHNATSTNTLNISTTGLLAGTYTVHMMNENGGNMTAYGAGQVQLIAVTPNPPVASFTGLPTAGTRPLNVSFTDTSTNAPTSWLWTFGDGSTSTLQNPTHIYTAAGTYTVTLNATNAYGSDTMTRTNYIRVSSGGGGGGGGGGGTPSSQETVGSASLMTNSLGQLLQSYIVDSKSKAAKLIMNTGVKALDKDGNPLREVTIDDLTAANVPGVPSGATFSFAGYAVNCGPNGATFSPSIQLKFEFTQEQWNTLMAQAEQNPSFLTVKWYNAELGVWESIQTRVNANSRTVTATVTHFSTFALFKDSEAATPVVTPIVTPIVTPVTPPATTLPTTPLTPGEPVDEFPWTYVIIGVIVILLIAGGAYYYTKKE